MTPVLKRIVVERFKAVESVSIDLTDTTLLVGPNNSGKSSVLQAIHFAARCMAQMSEPNKQGTISLREIEYIPTSIYKLLGHNGPWGNAAGTPESTVSFIFDVAVESGGVSTKELMAKIVLKSARNEGISAKPTIPVDLQPMFRGVDSVFSAYIPGISGIPITENFISRRNVFRKAASGDSNVVLRNILYIIKEEGKLEDLRKEVSTIYPNVHFDVSFDNMKDYDIDAFVTSFGGGVERKPLELAGTGFLQVLQIMSYLVLFNPSIILIDEPESHLHPTLQTKLIATLQRRMKGFRSRAIITTHSPFVARGLSGAAKTVWLRQGAVHTSSQSDTIRDALGWGALDRKVLLCTEDTNRSYLRKIIAQDESLVDKVCVVPLRGADKADTPAVISNIHSNLGGHHKVVVHRDRDFMTSEEVKEWEEHYDSTPFFPLVTEGSDIEAAFLVKENLASLLGVDEGDIDSIFSDVIEEDREILYNRFMNKRAEINKKLYSKTGGSPGSEGLWESWDFLSKVTGKEAMPKVRNVLGSMDLDKGVVGKISKTVEVAPSLLSLLRGL